MNNKRLQKLNPAAHAAWIADCEKSSRDEAHLQAMIRSSRFKLTPDGTIYGVAPDGQNTYIWDGINWIDEDDYDLAT